MPQESTPTPTPDRPQAYDDLKNHLQEMFQMDRGDLDFGIYRIMNMKREQIEDFLENRLLPQVHEILAAYRPTDTDRLERELAEAKANPGKFNPDYVEGLERQLNVTMDIPKVEAEIYSDLYNFFKRYYSEGDFMSLRRYKEGVYALPYGGEEVKLHWANHDQYYIKTTESLKHYTFKTDGGKRVRFEVTAASTEKNNNKAANGKERRFHLAAENTISVEDDLLTIRFEYRPDEAKRKQDKINEDMIVSLKSREEYLSFGLGVLAPTNGNGERTLLEKHLTTYTAKFTFDYFIHKDLGGFLRRELDFFIKNEIMLLDDIENESTVQVENYLGKIKAMRKVAHQIIRFLAQIEDFQKKLWLKKKFVLETHYCITLDRIIGTAGEKAAALLAEIAANEDQREEWVRLFAIDELAGYGTPLTAAFLKANDKLPVDTRFFDVAFKYALLGLFDDLDEATDGLLINSENFQALNLLEERYKGQVQAIYIDPPYNTNATQIIYKNGYKESSWLSLMENRLSKSKGLMKGDSSIAVTIDDFEMTKLAEMMNDIFMQENQLGIIAIRINPKGRMTTRKVSLVHEYALIYGKTENAIIKKLPVTPEEKSHNYRQDKDGTWFLPINLRKQGVDSESKRSDGSYHDRFFPIYFDPESQKISAKEELPIKIMPVDSNGQERIWRRSIDVIDEMYHSGDIWVSQSKNGYQVYFKFRGGLDGKMVQSMWTDAKYSASDHGTGVLDHMLGKREQFSYPKAPYAVQNCLLAMTDDHKAHILDYFAGSGTTGHVVINLNREDDGNRKYILVEMGEHFDTVTKPRVQKSAYSSYWGDGKPVSRDGVSQVMKYITLEQYEDALDNLSPALSKERADLLDDHRKAKDDYMLGYMMEMECAESLLSIDRFAAPFDYHLKISHDDEIITRKVDLIETFNYLLGLKVQKIRAYDNGIITVEGETLAAEKTLIIWRNADEIDTDALDAWFKKTHLQGRPEARAIYVNGDNNLENLKPDGQQWDVRLTELEFKRRMFDRTDI